MITWGKNTDLCSQGCSILVVSRLTRHAPPCSADHIMRDRCTPEDPYSINITHKKIVETHAVSSFGARHDGSGLFRKGVSINKLEMRMTILQDENVVKMDLDPWRREREAWLLRNIKPRFSFAHAEKNRRARWAARLCSVRKVEKFVGFSRTV